MRATFIPRLLLPLWLAGCASLAPPYAAPPLPVAPQYPQADVQSGTDAPGLAWQDYFEDAALRDLITLALAHNRDLRGAVLRVAEARAAYGIQRADRLPSLGAQAGMERSRVPADLNLTGHALTGAQYQVGLGLASWELDFWGRVRSLQDAALESYLASGAARRAASLVLVAQVANSYFTLCELDERLALARQTIASRAQTLRIFTRRVEVGSTSRLNLAQVETLLTQAQALGAQLAQAQETQWHLLTQLVGTPIEKPAPTRSLGERSLPAALRAGLPSALLAQRPDIAAAEHQLRAAHAHIGAARAAFFPRVALTGSFGSASAALSGLFDAGSQAWTFSPTVSLPLFDGERRRNNLTLTQVRRELAVARYEKSVQDAFRDVSDALSARRWFTEQAAIAAQALQVQSERARLSQLRFDHGAAAFIEVLDAQRDLLSAQQQLVQARRAVWTAHVGLYAALGGGALAEPENPAGAVHASP